MASIFYLSKPKQDFYLDMQLGFAKCVAISTTKEFYTLGSKPITNLARWTRNVKHTTKGMQLRVEA